MIAKNTILTRYLSFPKFIYLLESALFFPKATLFKDDLEGVMPISSSDIQLESPVSLEGFKPEDPASLNDIPLEPLGITEIKKALEWIYVSCWYEGDIENYAMWEIYGQIQESIAIQTTVEKIQLLFSESNNEMHTYMDKVHYKDPKFVDIDNLNSVSVLQKSSARYQYPSILLASHSLFLKHIGYSFENEIRIVAIDNKADLGKSNDQPGFEIPLNPALKFIDNIVISPFAPNWFRLTIEKTLERYNCSANLLRSNLKIR